MKTPIAVAAFAIVLFSCAGDNTIPPTNSPNIIGMNYTKSKHPFQDTYTTLQNTIAANPNIRTIAAVNHTKNAASVDLSLRPTQVIFFGNPKLGTPLMQRNPLAGLDLPQKIVTYQNELDEVFLGYNNIAYLSARHGLDTVATLPIIANALQQLSTTASENEINTPSNDVVALGEGIITKTSTKKFDDTYTSLATAITNNPNLRIIVEINHSSNATSVGMELNPTRVLIFGNPNLGTPLMLNAQTTALDLPQKMLVWEDDTQTVHVSYNNPAFLAKRHGITDTLLNTITKALDNLATVATN